MGHKKFRGGALTREEKTTTGANRARELQQGCCLAASPNRENCGRWIGKPARVNRNHRGRVPKDPSSAQRPRNGPRPIYR